MSTPGIRAALERLVELSEQRAIASAWTDAIAAARAALAEPVAEGPTDEDLYDLADVFNGDPVPAMRRALELWGRPAAPPAPEVGEVGELVAALEADAECAEVEHYDLCNMTADQMRRAAALLQQQAAPAPVVVPVAVADDRDPECVARWPECVPDDYDPRCCRFPKSCSCAHAIPLPQAGDGQP